MTSGFAQFVVKVSKFCNLRCRYCYEMPELGNRERMSLDQLQRMYHNIADFYRGRTEIEQIDLIWHGGEPLMIEPDYFWATFADQRDIFGDRFRVLNAVQTNLTVLDDERLKLLTAGFDAVGVSLDLFGGLRVNIGGRDQQDQVLDNIRRLAAHTSVGCITVLNATNIDHVDSIFRFYEEAGLRFRVLPLFDTGDQGQTAPYAVSLDDEIKAMARLVDLWLASDNLAGPPSPLDQYIRIAAQHLAGRPKDRYYDRREDGFGTLLVNTTGDCFSYGEPYGVPEWSLGNIFDTPMADMHRGPVFEACVTEAEKKQAANCLSCPYFGICDGALVTDNEQRRRDTDPAGTALCTARPVIEYIEARLRGSNIIETLADTEVDTSRAL